eukprot:5928317-Prymnesium_polylepis.1
MAIHAAACVNGAQEASDAWLEPPADTCHEQVGEEDFVRGERRGGRREPRCCKVVGHPRCERVDCLAM